MKKEATKIMDFTGLSKEEKLEKLREIFLGLRQETEGRKERTDSGIDFKSIDISRGVTISYTDDEGEKTFSSGEAPREKMITSFAMLSYNQRDQMGVKLYEDKDVYINCTRVTIHYDDDTGSMDKFRVSGKLQAGGWLISGWKASSPWITIMHHQREILNKIFDEAWLYIKGERLEKDLFRMAEEKEKADDA